MKKVFAVVIAALAVSCSSSLLAAETNKYQVDAIFQQALEADQADNRELHKSLLAEVLTLDPNHKLARWQSGQVMHNGEWRTLSAIERAVRSDARWQEYRDRVEAGTDTWGGHAGLARWCRTQGLDLEEQWHWFNVLRHDPGNREALGRLGVRPYRGEYHTQQQIAAYEAEEKQAKQNLVRYSDILKSALREAERSEGSQRTAALKKVSSINDPAAIQAIVQVVLADVKNERRILAKFGEENGEAFLRQMQLAANAALSGIPEHEATLSLLETALYASDSQVRTDAGHALRYREPTSFMPMLMAGLAAPIELSLTISRLPNGQITVFEDCTEEGPLSKNRHTRSSTFLTQHVNYHTHTSTLPTGRGGQSITNQSTSVSGVWSEQWRDMANAAAQVSNSQDQVELENAMRKERNSRIECVLELASGGKELGDNPQAWWSDWKAYNELSGPEETPINYTEENYDYSRYYEHETSSSSTPVVEGGGTGFTQMTNRPSSELPAGTGFFECFAAGTLVWTQSGPVPIETVRVGDFVLSQSPHTGELSYRPVVKTTMTPESPTVKLSLNDELIVATGGHRFWITGQGWRMAKLITTGDQLLSATGSIDVQVPEKGTEVNAYNLEVGEFHTYFVGKSRVLVHDHTCPEPTINVVPGISPRADYAPKLAVRN